MSVRIRLAKTGKKHQISYRIVACDSRAKRDGKFLEILGFYNPHKGANENFMMLQEELSGTESKIAYARQFYNDNVLTFNTAIQTFPGNIVAGIFGFKENEFFEIEEAEKKPIKVKF